MTSLLCQKSNSGRITSSNRDLCDILLKEDNKHVPYMIKEKKTDSIIISDENDSLIHSISNAGFNNSNKSTQFTLKNQVGGSYLKNSVMFDIPASGKTTRSSIESCKKVSESEKQYNAQQPIKSNLKTRDLMVSSTLMASSVPATHSSLSSMSMDKFNNNNFQHEHKKFNRKKLKHMQQQLENRLCMRSATTNDIYKELNQIINDEKTFAQKINNHKEKCDQEKQLKREIIYKSWYRNVYEPMQSGIYNTMLSNQAQYARNIRNLKYLEYLNQCNKRNRVYQDDFEPNDYDPLNVISLEASVIGKLLDPTTLSQRKEFKEVNMISKDIRLPIITKIESPPSHIVWNNWIMDQYNTVDSQVRTRIANSCNASRHSSEYNLEWDRASNNTIEPNHNT